MSLPPRVIPDRSGASLVVTLLVTAILAVIVVTMLEAVRSERLTARAFSAGRQAQLGAEAGLIAAEQRITELFRQYPDAATAWQKIPEGLGTEGTVFHFRAAESGAIPPELPEAAGPADFNQPGEPPAVYHLAVPLMSGGTPVEASALLTAFPDGLGETNSVDLNADGWIGEPPDGPRPELRAAWVEILRDPHRPRDLTFDPATGRAVNPPIARYAFWVEDESFRVNLNTASAEPRGEGTPGGSPREVPLAGPLAATLPEGSSITAEELAAQLGQRREELPGARFAVLSNLGHASDPPPGLLERLRFVTTLQSSALNVARGGYRRPDLSVLLDPDAWPDRQRLDRVVAAIINGSASPSFGQRLHRGAGPGPADEAFEAQLNVPDAVPPRAARIYVEKLVANLRDAVDSDHQPTLLRNDPLGNPDAFPVVEEGRPAEGAEPLGGGTVGPNPFAAIGHENLPYLQEYVLQARLLRMEPPGFSGSVAARPAAAFEFSIDHYFEFWNPGIRDIVVEDSSGETADLGAGAFLLLYNQPSIGDHPNARGAVTPPIPEGRPIELRLADFREVGTGEPLRFEAGAVTVLTTAPVPNPALISPGSAVYHVPGIDPEHRLFRGTTRDFSAENTSGFPTDHTNTYRVLMNFRSNERNDYESAILLGNASGLLGSHCALSVVGTSGYALSLEARTPEALDHDAFFVRGGSLRGNRSVPSGPASTSGDPRALNEQLELVLYDPAGGPDQTRFYSSGLANGTVPADSTLGAANDNFVAPDRWPDFTPQAARPSRIPDRPLVSIGELGHLLDPARIPGEGAIDWARGGGRTLRIGQSDAWDPDANRAGLWDGEDDSASRTWVAWRLVDLFSLSSAAELEGAININGIDRDGGIAFRSALYGYRFELAPEGASGLSGTELQPEALDELTAALLDRFRGSDPGSPLDDRICWERGELSELPLFHTATAFNGVDFTRTIDRGREELVRRLLGLITTRGNTYRIHAVGQALRVDRNGRVRPVATRRISAAVRLESEALSATDDTFDPDDPEAVEARFRPVDDFQPRRLWILSE